MQCNLYLMLWFHIYGCCWATWSIIVNVDDSLVPNNVIGHISYVNPIRVNEILFSDGKFVVPGFLSEENS